MQSTLNSLLIGLAASTCLISGPMVFRLDARAEPLTIIKGGKVQQIEPSAENGDITPRDPSILPQAPIPMQQSGVQQGSMIENGAPHQTLNAPLNAATSLSLSRDGFYRSDVAINGVKLPAIIDTATPLIALPYDEAKKIGASMIDAAFTLQMVLPNGSAKAAPIKLSSFTLGPILLSNVDAVVVEPNALQTTLIGMNFFNLISSYDVKRGIVTLRQSGTNLQSNLQ